MKYRVKFQCYWYNTGAGDNHHYTKAIDFDLLRQAEEFKRRIQRQFETGRTQFYIENGFISGPPTLCGLIEQRELCYAFSAASSSPCLKRVQLSRMQR